MILIFQRTFRNIILRVRCSNRLPHRLAASLRRLELIPRKRVRSYQGNARSAEDVRKKTVSRPFLSWLKVINLHVRTEEGLSLLYRTKRDIAIGCLKEFDVLITDTCKKKQYIKRENKN